MSYYAVSASVDVMTDAISKARANNGLSVDELTAKLNASELVVRVACMMYGWRRGVVSVPDKRDTYWLWVLRCLNTYRASKRPAALAMRQFFLPEMAIEKYAKTDALSTGTRIMMQAMAAVDWLGIHTTSFLAAVAPYMRTPGGHTPPAVVVDLVRAAMAPMLAHADSLETAEARVDYLLGIRIVDPAMGSGQFLVFAATVLASAISAYAPAEWPPERARAAVASACIYGVDLDARMVAATLAMMVLFVGDKEYAATELASHLRCGDAILGAVTPSDIHPAVPFPLECNRFGYAEAVERLGALRFSKAHNYGVGLTESSVERVFSLRPSENTTELLAIYKRGQYFMGPMLRRLVHWFRVFPDVLGRETDPGFDLVLTHPPSIINAVSIADRHAKCEVLHDLGIFSEYGQSQSSSVYYLVFVARLSRLLRSTGRAGVVLPIGFFERASCRDACSALLTGEFRGQHIDLLCARPSDPVSCVAVHVARAAVAGPVCRVRGPRSSEERAPAECVYSEIAIDLMTHGPHVVALRPPAIARLILLIDAHGIGLSGAFYVTKSDADADTPDLFVADSANDPSLHDDAVSWPYHFARPVRALSPVCIGPMTTTHDRLAMYVDAGATDTAGVLARASTPRIAVRSAAACPTRGAYVAAVVKDAIILGDMHVLTPRFDGMDWMLPIYAAIVNSSVVAFMHRLYTSPPEAEAFFGGVAVPDLHARWEAERSRETEAENAWIMFERHADERRAISPWHFAAAQSAWILRFILHLSLLLSRRATVETPQHWAVLYATLDAAVSVLYGFEARDWAAVQEALMERAT
jgi:hypothetical protein